MQQEIETRFLEIDKPALVQKLRELGAKDHGEILLKEIIFYNADHTWPSEGRLVRIRQHGDRETRLTYKHHRSNDIDGTDEAEFTVSDPSEAEHFLKAIGLVDFRRQEKRRHTFTLDDVTIDIDSWPTLPPYVEFEAAAEAPIKQLVEKLGFTWSDANFEQPRKILQERYNIPLDTVRSFTFDGIVTE